MTRLLVLFLSASLLMALAACKKDLDFTADDYYRVRDFLRSQNCDTECGQVADCEGIVVKLKGRINAENVERETFSFLLEDEKNSNCHVSVSVDSLIATDIFDDILLAGSGTVKIEGLIEGHDEPGNLKCKRGFSLKLENREDLVFE